LPRVWELQGHPASHESVADSPGPPITAAPKPENPCSVATGPAAATPLPGRKGNRTELLPPPVNQNGAPANPPLLDDRVRYIFHVRILEFAWAYQGTRGSHFRVVRSDGPHGKKVWQTPRGIELKAGEKWIPYIAGGPVENGVHQSGAIKNGNPILIVEGERTADAAAQALPALSVLTCQRGARHNDWSLCKGRDVLVPE